MMATRTALSVRVDALTDTAEKSTPTAATIGLENRAKLEARLRAPDGESDATGSGRQKCVKLDPALSTYQPAADAVRSVRTHREPIESAVKAALGVKEKGRAIARKRWAEK